MKTLQTILIITFCFIFFSSFKINSKTVSEKTATDRIDYYQLNKELFDHRNEVAGQERVVIINMKGERIREDRVETDNVLSSPVLMPLIQRSDLIMKINKTSYYLLNSK